jgi:hypothetical protein
VNDVHELRYGYNLANLDQLAHAAVSRARYGNPAGQWADRFEVAWEAVAESLYAADEAPTGYDLIGVGMNAIAEDYRADRRHRGHSNERSFQAVWADLASVTGSHEGHVVERFALTQIWPTLSNRQRQVLSALATFGDHQPAAEALGMSAGLFSAHVSRARRRFLELWHEGEEPSRPWGTDRRSSTPGARRKGRASYVKRRQGRPERVLKHGDPNTYRNHACRCTPCHDAAMAEQRVRRARAKEAVAA